jgi:hypothetical protein
MRKTYGKHGIRASVVLTLMLGLMLACFVASASAGQRDRPFKGQLSGTITFSPGAPDPPFLWVTTNAVGQVSHMGRTVMWSQHAAANEFGGVMALTAANGDRVDCVYTGVGNIPPDIAIGEWYTVSSDTTITGGTGRFAHASGHMEGTASLQFMGLGAPVWPGIWNWAGRIKY